MLHPHPSHMQGYMKTQRDGGRFTNQMESQKKKKQELQFSSDKIDFKATKTRRNKGHYIMVKGSMQQEELTILNTYVPNTGASRYIGKFLTIYKET